MTTTTPTRLAPAAASRSTPQRVATALAGAIAMLYGLLYAGVLDLGVATAEELGILGVASGVFAVLAGLLWWRRSRVLWTVAAVLQALMGWMYVAIAPDRDPSFEVWGITIRLLSVALVITLLTLLLAARRNAGARAEEG